MSGIEGAHAPEALAGLIRQGAASVAPFALRGITAAAEIMAVVKSWMEISGARLVENLRAVQEVVGAEVETLAVVKANGYGHDAALVAGVLADAGLRWLGVSDVKRARGCGP